MGLLRDTSPVWKTSTLAGEGRLPLGFGGPVDLLQQSFHFWCENLTPA